MKKYLTVDLCAGIGGIRKGFELTNRTKNILSAENDKFACATYEHLYKEDSFNDITTDEFKQKINLIKYDVLLAGFPCQNFSLMGLREGFKDEIRGTLFFHIAEIIEKDRPKMFLLENVEGLLSHQKGKTFNKILDVLINELDYSVVGVNKDLTGEDFTFDKKDIVLNARNFGLPQNRPRVYLLGFDNKRYSSNLKNVDITSLPQSRSKYNIYNDLNDILDLSADEKYYLSSGYLETLKKHKAKQSKKGNGFGYAIINEPNIKNPVSNALLATGGSGKERNLVLDYQEDVIGKVVKNKQSPINNECVRSMTPWEWGKLQGFIGYAFIEDGKEHFSFPIGISDTQQYKQFGNSVAIPVIEEIAHYAIEILDELEL